MTRLFFYLDFCKMKNHYSKNFLLWKVFFFEKKKHYMLRTSEKNTKFFWDIFMLTIYFGKDLCIFFSFEFFPIQKN